MTEEEAKNVRRYSTYSFNPKRVYIAGKVSGIDIDVYTDYFAKATEFAKKFFGCEVVNPILLGGVQYTWQDNMKFCLKELLECDTIIFIPGWETSQGARLEFTIAEELGYNLGEFDWSLITKEFSYIHEIKR